MVWQSFIGVLKVPLSFAKRRLSGQIEKLRQSGNPTLHFGWLHMLAGWRVCWMSSYSRCILRQLLVKKVKVKDKYKKTLSDFYWLISLNCASVFLDENLT